MSDSILVDRIEVINIFNSMVDAAQPAHVLRMTGSEKMGKSRLMREFRHIAEDQWHAKCALVDLRSTAQDYNDILFSITEQLGIEYFPNYKSVRENLSTQPRVEVGRVNQLLSALTIYTEHSENIEAQQKRRLTSSLLQDFKAIPSNSRIVLLLDAFEQASISVQSWINEQLVIGLCRLRNIYIVLAGRTLPQPPVNWEDTCHSYDLLAVSLNHHREYCIKLGIKVSDDTLSAFHEAFEGKPGLFVEYASKLSPHR